MARWDTESWWQVLRSGDKPSLECRAAHYTEAVLVELERLCLTWARNLQVYRDHGCPWIPMVLNRMETSEEKKLIPLLTYISAVAMLTNGDYIVYTQLYELKKTLPYSQARLQQLQILSNFTFQKYTGMTLYKLHQDIPVKLVKRTQPKPREGQKKQQQEDLLEVPLEVAGELTLDEDHDCPPVGKLWYLLAALRHPAQSCFGDLLRGRKEPDFHQGVLWPRSPPERRTGGSPSSASKLDRKHLPGNAGKEAVPGRGGHQHYQCALGSALIKVVLQDLLDRNAPIPLGALQRPAETSPCRGTQG